MLYVAFAETSAVGPQTGSRGKNIFFFTFCEGEDVYDDGCADNAGEWQRLLTYYQDMKHTAGSDDYYFLLESYIYTNVENPGLKELNRATLRAGSIRSLLKFQLGVSSEQIAFCINRSGRVPGQVKVTVVRQPMPPGVNRDIFYSLSNSTKDIYNALTRYPEIPYYDLYYYEAKAVSNKVAAAAATEKPSAEKPSANVSGSKVAATKPLRELPANPARPDKKSSSSVPHSFYMGIKTNLIPWLGVVPSWGLGGESASGYTKGAMMYNGTVECCFAKRYSLEASFLYSYTSFGGRSDNLWGISQLTVEPRCWVFPDGAFRGMSAGLRLGYGDFDMRNNKPEKQGKTGRFYSMALTVGYTQPVFRHWLLEGRAWVGYRNVYDGKNYRVDDADRKNYLEKGFAEGQWMVGVELNLGFRLGFR